MKRTDEDIKVEKGGCTEDSFTYSHPSYGMISVCRRSGGSEDPLFGSEVGSNTTMCIRIEKAEVVQDLGRNWYHSRDMICELIMSPVQYAEMITNPNTQGMPCTIRYTQEEGCIKYRGIDTQTQYVEKHIETKIAKMKKEASDVANQVAVILDRKGPMKKEDKLNIACLVNKLTQNVTSNLPFYEKCIKENIDRQKLEARTEVESFVAHAITKAGIKTLNSPEALALVLKDDPSSRVEYDDDDE